MDFGAFGDGSNRGAPTTNNGASQPDATTPTAGANAGNNAEPVFMHTMEHQGVFCDVCEGRIRGFRYKCLSCSDFDLCSTCERKGHHPGHVMMRIAFPEQTGDAIRRHFNAPGSGHHRMSGFPHGFESARRHCHFRGAERAARESEGESGDEPTTGQAGPAGAAGCPYGLGRKGMKKWAKCMKKMAYQQRRSAETYARSCAQTAASASGLAPDQSTAAGENAAGQQQFDFTAAASQIQEFLNAFGIPIDVVELYDSYGNNGQPRTSAASASTASTPSTGTPATTSEARGETENLIDTGAPVMTPTTTKDAAKTVTFAESATTTAQPTTNLAANLQQLHIDSQNTPTAPSGESQHVTMDVDADAGWMLVDNDHQSSNFGSNETVMHIPIQIGSNSAQSSGPASTEESNGNATSTAAPTAVPMGDSASAPRAPGNGNGGGMYPVLNPQLQQLLSGVSQAMNSVVRNIPIVTNPNGPVTTTSASGGPASIPAEMDTKCVTTLNQLLAMGFSNHDQWLSRLVIAKKGDLEAVLNALFPGNGA